MKDLNIDSTSLNFYGKNINDLEAQKIAKALELNTTLTSLNLGKNYIGDEGAIAIGNALKNNTTLATLNLEQNRIEDKGAIAIGDGLNNNMALTTLILGQNDIGDEGAIAIGGGLNNNATLTSLNLDHNQIGYEGAIAIGDGLKNNMALTSLNLWENELEAEGAMAIIERIKNNMALTSLNLGENQIGDVKKAIEEKTNYNKALFQKLTSLLYNYFFENNNANYAFKILTANKFYQVVNKQLLKKYLAERGVNDIETKLKELDNFINQKAFTIAGVCKEIKPDTELATPSDIRNNYIGHISELPPELIAHITSYLDGSPWGLEVKVLKDKLLLNYPKLLKAMLKEFTLEKIVALSNKLSLDLITQALSSEYNEGEELILGGLMSVEYPEAPAG